MVAHHLVAQDPNLKLQGDVLMMVSQDRMTRASKYQLLVTELLYKQVLKLGR